MALAWMLAAIPVLAADHSDVSIQAGVTTNYVTAHRSFRRVDGQLYNVEKSLLWRDIRGRCAKVLTNGTVVRTFVERSETTQAPVSDAGRSISNLLGGRSSMATVRTRRWEEEGPEIFLVNYESSGLTPGKAIRAKAIKVGTFTYEGEVMEQWDCGIPNVVPVLVTNLPARQPKPDRKAVAPPVAK